jgi:hypothetical protein
MNVSVCDVYTCNVLTGKMKLRDFQHADALTEGDYSISRKEYLFMVFE